VVETIRQKIDPLLSRENNQKNLICFARDMEITKDICFKIETNLMGFTLKNCLRRGLIKIISLGACLYFLVFFQSFIKPQRVGQGPRVFFVSFLNLKSFFTMSFS
jgi:hypothetical protein